MVRGGIRLTLSLAAAAVLATAHAARADGVHAYVGSFIGDVVSRIDLATNEAIPIPVGASPMGVAASADGSRVVVASNVPGSASIIDGTTGAVLATVPVGAGPIGVGVLPDGSKAYVANAGDGTVSVLDVANAAVVDTLPVEGFPFAVATSPSGHRAYVTTTSGSSGTMVVIDTSTDTIVANVLVSTVSETRGVVASADGSRVYVGLTSAIAVVDATTNLLLDDVSFPCDLGCNAVHDLTVTPDGSRVYASGAVLGGVVVVDTANLDFTTIPSSSAFSDTISVDVTPDGKTVYAINSASGTIDLIDVATGTVTATLIALVPAPIAIGEFIAGPAPVVPPPVLDAAARSCQRALLDAYKSVGVSAHKLLAGCLQRLQKDHAAGAVTSATTTACLRDADPSSATSRLAKARTAARARVLARCGATTPAALGSPCDASADSLAEVADCVLDRQLEAAAALLGHEVKEPCGLLALVELDDDFPTLCG